MRIKDVVYTDPMRTHLQLTMEDGTSTVLSWPCDAHLKTLIQQWMAHHGILDFAIRLPRTAHAKYMWPPIALGGRPAGRIWT